MFQFPPGFTEMLPLPLHLPAPCVARATHWLDILRYWISLSDIASSCSVYWYHQQQSSLFFIVSVHRTLMTRCRHKLIKAWRFRVTVAVAEQLHIEPPREHCRQICISKFWKKSAKLDLKLLMPQTKSSPVLPSSDTTLPRYSNIH